MYVPVTAGHSRRLLLVQRSEVSSFCAICTVIYTSLSTVTCRLKMKPDLVKEHSKTNRETFVAEEAVIVAGCSAD